MLLFSAHHLAGAVIVYPVGAEDWFLVARTERREALQVGLQMLGYVFEVYFCINVERRLCLLGRNMLFYIMLEPVSELSYLILSQGESGSIGMTAEIEQEVAAALDG